MSYQIKITKTEPNPNFETERKEYNNASMRGYGPNQIIPNKDKEIDVLTCELTEDQFKKVKAECLKVFE